MNKQIITLLEQIKDLKKETNKEKKYSGLVIITSNQKSRDSFVILPIRKNPMINCVSIALHKMNSLSKILKNIDGKVDYIIIDGEQKINGMEDLVKNSFLRIKKSQFLTFKGNDHTADATDAIINELLPPTSSKIISIIGTGNIGIKVALRLAERGNIVYMSGSNLQKAKKTVDALNLLKSKNSKGKILAKPLSIIPKHCEVLMAFTPSVPVITEKMIEKMNIGSLVIDGGIGTIYPDAIKKSQEKKITIIRLDIRAGFSAAIALAIETKKLASEHMGRKIFMKKNTVSGGQIGEFGDIVVDTIAKPKQIIGIADGKGGVIHLNIKFNKQGLIKIDKILNQITTETNQLK